MKVAISSTGRDADSAVDPRFGRCQFFIIADLDDMSFEANPNGTNALEGGAGIQAAKAVVDLGAQAVLTGYIGPNAARVLGSAGLEAVTGVSGTVREAVERYKQGLQKPVQRADERDRSLVKGSGGGLQRQGTRQVPAGPGMGRGMGGGGRSLGGRGMGGGGRSMGGRGMGGGGRGMGGGRKLAGG